MLDAMLERLLQTGSLSVTWRNGRTSRYGRNKTPNPDVAVRLVGPLTPLKLGLHPDLYLGEAYMSGALCLERGTLWDLMTLLGRNLAIQQDGLFLIGEKEMRLIVVSDVHGNCLSLETALAGMRKTGYDHIVCNGDMIQGGPQPHETVQLLREMKCSIVMGNSDAWLMTGIETDAHLIPEERRKKLDAVREWSLSKLDQDDCAFINSFQPTVPVDLGQGRSLLAFHGSPTSLDQVLLPSTEEDEFQET